MPHRRAKRFVPEKNIAIVKERSGGICECLIMPDGTPSFPDYCWPLRCNRKAMRQPHHLKKRSRGGNHNPENLLDCCFTCHAWIEAHDAEAIKRGLSELAGRIE